MHYYSFNIGDYASSTSHLEPLEDLAYRRLLDLYYSSEQPIPEDLKKTSRLIRMRTHSEFIATVLDEFFTLEADGWHCERADVEIFKYNEKSYKASKSAKSRWKKAKQKQKVKSSCKGNANALKTHSEGNAKQEPLTTNQEPITIIKDLLSEPEVKTSKYKFNSYQMEFAEWMFSQLLLLNPNFKKPNLESWANILRLMLEVDKRDAIEVGKVFTWANNDPFWSANILSPTSLRKQFDALVVKMKQPVKQNKTSIEGDGSDWRRFESEML